MGYMSNNIIFSLAYSTPYNQSSARGTNKFCTKNKCLSKHLSIWHDKKTLRKHVRVTS